MVEDHACFPLWQENKNKSGEWKPLVKTVEIKNADLKVKFLFYSFAAFRTAHMQGKAANCHMLLRMIREIKVSSDWFRCVLVISLYVAKVFSESVTKSSSCLTNVIFCNECKLCSKWHWRSARKLINDLNASLGSRQFLYVMSQRESFASWASAFKSSKLLMGLKWTSDQKVAYVFVTFEWNWWSEWNVVSVFLLSRL